MYVVASRVTLALIAWINSTHVTQTLVRMEAAAGTFLGRPLARWEIIIFIL